MAYTLALLCLLGNVARDAVDALDRAVGRLDCARSLVDPAHLAVRQSAAVFDVEWRPAAQASPGGLERRAIFGMRELQPQACILREAFRRVAEHPQRGRA